MHIHTYAITLGWKRSETKKEEDYFDIDTSNFETFNSKLFLEYKYSLIQKFYVSSILLIINILLFNIFDLIIYLGRTLFSTKSW